MEQVRRLVKFAGESLRKAKEGIKKNFDAHERPLTERLEQSDFVFYAERPYKMWEKLASQPINGSI